MAGDGDRVQRVPGRQRVGQRLVHDRAAAAVRARRPSEQPARPVRAAGQLVQQPARAAVGVRPVTKAASSRTVGCRNRSITPTGAAACSAAQPGHHLGGQQRVPAQVEEVVVDADPLHAQHLRPDLGQRRLQLGRAVPRSAAARTRRRSGAGSALRSSLPFGVSGSASSATNAAGTMYSGRRLGAGARAARPAPRRPPRTPPAACRPARPRAPATTAVGHARAARAARASISPSSMRKPRTFTWWSSAAQELERAVGAASAPGRRCGTAARPARPRTGRGRTARRSAPAGPGSRAPACTPPMYSSPATPTGHRPPAGVQHVERGVRRSARRSAPRRPRPAAPGTAQQVTSTAASVGPYRLCSSRAGQPVVEAPRQRRRQRLAAADHPAQRRAAGLDAVLGEERLQHRRHEVGGGDAARAISTSRR